VQKLTQQQLAALYFLFYARFVLSLLAFLVQSTKTDTAACSALLPPSTSAKSRQHKSTNTDAAARASAKVQKFTQQLAALYVVFYDRFGINLLPFLVPKYKNLRSSVQRCTSSSTSASSLLMPHTTRLRDRTM
jgi:hypothetical protein